jgi:uncharacterized membrane protein
MKISSIFVGFPNFWLRLVLITVLVLGLLFRFVNLDRKVYWHDETYTSLWLSGYSKSELLQQTFRGEVISIGDLQKYQSPNADKDLTNTIKNLAAEEPQHPPLYYTVAWFWCHWFGSSTAALRSLSAIISLLLFPSIYWLCLELFDSTLIAWMAIALVAVSPFQVLYAQEARQYSLWAVTIVLMSAALLRAIRVRTNLSWTIYTVTLTLGLYTFLLSGLVAISHGLYVLVHQKLRFSQLVRNYLIASLAAVLLFAPWLLHIGDTTGLDWVNSAMPLSTLVKTWLDNPTRIFLDLNFSFNNRWSELLPRLLGPLCLIGYSFYWLCRHAPRKVWWFVGTLVGVTGLALLLPDLLLGGRRSTISRYLIPTFLGIHLAVAYLLGTKVVSTKAAMQKLWIGITAIVISSGVLSCVVSLQADTWWTKRSSQYNHQIAALINRSPSPLLVSSDRSPNIGDVLSLSHLLKPDTAVQLVIEPQTPQIPASFDHIFLLNPSERMQDELKAKGYRLETVHTPGKLWKISQP